MGVDFEEETVEEEIVTALPEEGLGSCFGAGVAVDFLGGGFVEGGGSDWGLGIMTSWWTGLRISSTCARFLTTICSRGAAGILVSVVCGGGGCCSGDVGVPLRYEEDAVVLLNVSGGREGSGFLCCG